MKAILAEQDKGKRKGGKRKGGKHKRAIARRGSAGKVPFFSILKVFGILKRGR